MKFAIIAFFAAFCSILLRVFQQKNVIHGLVRMAAGTSMLIAMADVVVVTSTVASSYWICIPIGLGGACGSVTAMKLHDKFRRLYERT